MNAATRQRLFTLPAGILAALLGCSPAWAQYLRPADVVKLVVARADARVPYGNDPLEFGELRLPKGKGPYAVAVIIHGGGWLSRYADLQIMAAFSDALTLAGVGTWNIEYRRVGNPGGGHMVLRRNRVEIGNSG